ncbi:TetR/AcrR family transcriptional regulator [Streptomyces sp. 8L]|uniref:TetR/AcrR family transcriptional regulator n=1 Tax=Streptomyces sp. 8L TaxID=2877242 RepID=UPI001CD2E4C7|nr:TetR/AcrR family transcriptional regulator [Streptomyces sp. 8L]MCA1221115.1 TetR/AcrR family transcriptional regulator [Streptomyces sp. 8L]
MSTVGRPRAFDMEQVLEAAAILFWEHGYEATSMAQLRDATGLSSASLYGSFGSKHGLFERAVEHYMAGPGSVTAVVDDESLSPREAVHQMLHRSIDMQTDPSHPLGCLVSLAGTVGGQEKDRAAAHGTMKAWRAVGRGRIRACIVRGVAAGELAEETDVDAVASVIHSFLLGLSTQACDGMSAPELHAAADAVLAVWPVPVRSGA